ncbi:MAG: sulfotransferase [Phormidesmis sp.]
MIYIVLGMHKSGTTLISQLLHTSGINMLDGAENSSTYDQGNQWERESTKQINHAVLNSQDLYSLDISLAKLKPSSEVKRQIKLTIKSINQNNLHWGFKDPRTCLTYPLWASELPEHRIVAVYRSPTEVWERYQKQGLSKKENIKVTAFKFMRAWSTYNFNILRILKSISSESILINYSDLMSSKETFKALEEFVGLSLLDKRDPSLYRDHSDGSERYLDYIGHLNLFYRQPHHKRLYDWLEKHPANAKEICRKSSYGSGTLNACHQASQHV